MNSNNSNSSDNKIPEKESLIDFPCEFPLKVMGRNHPEFQMDMCRLIENHINHSIELADVLSRPSRSGKYTAVTITITAESKEQLDTIYQALYAHNDVKMTL